MTDSWNQWSPTGMNTVWMAFFFFFQPMFSQQQAQIIGFSRAMFWRMLSEFYYFKELRRARIMCPLRNKPSILSRNQHPLLYLSEYIRANKLVRVSVSPQSGQNAEPEARIHPSTCPKHDPVGKSLGISSMCKLRIRLNDRILLKSRNSMLWCVS